MSRQRLGVILVALFVLADIVVALYLVNRARPHAAPAPVTSADPSDTASVEPSSSATAEEITGPLTLTGAPDGSVLRVTRGSCDGKAAQAWLIRRKGTPAEVSVDGLTQALAVTRTGSGWRIVGTDSDCSPRIWTSSNGTAWKKGTLPPEALFVSPENNGTVSNSAGPVRMATPCSVAQVFAVGGGRNLLLCRGGSILLASGSGSRISFSSYQAGPSTTTALQPLAEGVTAYLYGDSSCNAAFSVTDGAETTDYHCFGAGRAPLGLTKAGNTLVAQIGYEVWEQRGDKPWTRRG